MISKTYHTDDNRPSTLEDEFNQIAIDFDGVIHLCSKGFHDGTIYDPPIEGSLEAVKEIASKYTVVVYSAKARSDRPLVDGKTGIELIWEWLEQWNMKQYISDVVVNKPNALIYIDDKGLKFESWRQTMRQINE